ncbi:MAG: hypothetical protein AAGG07_01965 [Planctomycetota bacterium]
MTMAPPFELGWERRLAEAVQEAHALCERLAADIDAQRRAVEAGDAEEIGRVIGERAGLRDRLDEAARALTPFSSDWRRAIAGLAEAGMKDAADRAEKLVTLAASVAAADRRDLEVMKKKRAELARDLGGVQQRRSAAHAYRPAGAPTGPVFQDREG